MHTHNSGSSCPVSRKKTNLGGAIIGLVLPLLRTSLFVTQVCVRACLNKIPIITCGKINEGASVEE